MPLICPTCASTNVQKVSIVYLSGVSTVTAQTNTVGIGTNGDGAMVGGTIAPSRGLRSSSHRDLIETGSLPGMISQLNTS